MAAEGSLKPHARSCVATPARNAVLALLFVNTEKGRRGSRDLVVLSVARPAEVGHSLTYADRPARPPRCFLGALALVARASAAAGL
jgi:hypothetical protein